MGARYVLLGLAPVRSAWFSQVAQWANASSVPAEFVKSVSAAEVRTRLSSERPFSALLVDAAVTSLDRDLVEAAQLAGCAVIVVGDGIGGRNWVLLGANATLPAGFDRKDLLETLATHSVMIGRGDELGGDSRSGTEESGAWQASLVAVCGSGGTGASTVAIALAQGLAADVRARGSVVLADLALHAEQAMLHDARDVVPGVQELVDLCRSGYPTVREVRALAYAVAERDYALLLGLRQSRAWATIRPRGFAAALEALRRSYRVVVADVDADVEGEEQGGSMEVEERHIMARTALGGATVVAVVGAPGMKGIHSLVRIVADLLTFGIASDRLLPVINRAPRSIRARAQLSATLAELLPGSTSTRAAVFLPERRVDEALRDGVRLPDALSAPLARAVTVICEQAGAPSRPDGPQLVAPRSIGHWGDDSDLTAEP